MAIILLAPKHTQRIIFWIVVFLVVGGLFVASLVIFPPSLYQTQPEVPGGQEPGPSINLSVLDSERVAGLESLGHMGLEFSYVARNAAGKMVAGKILAEDSQAATRILSENGLRVVTLEESPVGRNQPFAPY